MSSVKVLMAKNNIESKPKLVPQKKGREEDKTIWKKNWFDVEKELPSVSFAQKVGMINSYIKKIKECKTEDLFKLLYQLRVRALIVIFFGLEEVEQEIEEPFVRYLKFLKIDISTNRGWNDYRDQNADAIITKYQYAYALSTAGFTEQAGKAFTEADRLFGALRHAKYLLSLRDL